MSQPLTFPGELELLNEWFAQQDPSIFIDQTMPTFGLEPHGVTDPLPEEEPFDPRIDIAFAPVPGVLASPIPRRIPQPIPLNQEVPMAPSATNGAQPVSELGGVPVPSPQLVEGADLRDSAPGVPGLAGLPVAAGAIGVVAAMALRILRQLMGRVTTVTAGHLSRLPSWARTALAGIGIGVGFDMARDLPGIPGASSILGVGGDGGAHFPQHLVDGHLGAHILGSWVANGVRFYRLSDGKLAVQNKHGKWKVWRPKKPIVIMPGGAGNLRTLLRADAVLNRQAKKIAAMLNRRTGSRSKKTPVSVKRDVVVVQDGRVAQITP